MAIMGLGLDFGPLVPTAASVLVAVKDYDGINFWVTGEDTFTLKSADTYDGSPTDMATITDYWTAEAVNGSDTYARTTQAAADTVVNSGDYTTYFFVDAADLPAGAQYVEVVPSDAGTVIALPGHPLPGRDPTLMRVVSGSSS